MPGHLIRPGHDLGRAPGVLPEAVDGPEYLRPACEEAAQPIFDQAFEFTRGHAPAAGCAPAPPRDEAFGDIIAVSGSLLVGMARGHSLARVVVDQTGQEARLGRVRATRSLGPVCRELPLHLFPERLVDDRGVFTGIALFLVHDFAAVDAVLQKVIERPAGQGLAARLAAVRTAVTN